MSQFSDDWIAIHQLQCSNAWNYDTPDFEGLVDLYTDDAVCKFGAYGTWTGKDEIRAGYRENVGAADNHFPTLHAVATPIIEIDGDEATGKWYLLDHVLTRGPGVPPNGVLGVYHARYRRDNGRWRIAELDLSFLWNADVGRIQPGKEVKLAFHADE
jgi:ketosteroid isomerase-like protein